MTVLGLDIGNTGAVALVGESGELVDVVDMPTLNDGPSGRPAVNAALLAAIVARAGASLAYVEQVGPRPTDGSVQAFAFGRCKGVVEGVLAACGVPAAFLAPPAWKRLVGIAPGKAGAKDAARSEAIRRWPAKAALFSRIRDDGRAEAALRDSSASEALTKENETMDIFPPAKQRPALLALRDALGCRDNALRRDECGDWRINGRQGHVYAVPEGFQLVFFARCGVTEWDGEGPHIEDYIRAKRNLIFCRLAMDGTGEGIFFLDRLPAPSEAEVIRDTLVIFKKRDMGEPSVAQMTARAAFASRARTNASKTRTADAPHPQDGAVRYLSSLNAPPAILDSKLASPKSGGGSAGAEVASEVEEEMANE